LDNELVYLLALREVQGVGDVLGRKLLSHFGSAQQVFNAREKEFAAIEGLTKYTARNILRFTGFKKFESEHRFLERNNIRWISIIDDDYPERLRFCNDAPILVFFKGNISLNSGIWLSIVGTRAATTYGTTAVKDMIRDLIPYKPVIASGLAYGIDIAAHTEALDVGLDTVAVVAHDLRTIYPRNHRDQAKRIMQQGGVLTEFSLGQSFEKKNFPRRNRIIAGISDATLVIESQKIGGAVITANIANSYNRDVFALPGRITDPFSAGCNELLRKNEAILVQNGLEIATYMGWKSDQVRQVQRQLFTELSSDEKAITTVLKTQPEGIQIDLLSLKAKMPVSKTSAILLSLEMKGLIRGLPGKRFQLV
jgi:DNA processing protein